MACWSVSWLVVCESFSDVVVESVVVERMDCYMLSGVLSGLLCMAVSV